VKRMIHKKQIDNITSVEFHRNDLTILQDGSLVVLLKDDILRLAQLIENEKRDNEFYEVTRRGFEQ
jgi:hypothetical protein